MGSKKFEPKPLAYPKTANPPKSTSRRRVQVAVGNADRRVDAAAPESSAPQLTGHYEQDDSLATLQVNQTGDFVVCWHVDYVTKTLTKFEGDRLSPQSFAMRKEFAQKQTGQLSSVLANEILFRLGNTTFIFKKVANGPTLSESAISMLPTEARPITVRHQHFPLTFADRQRIKAAFSPSAIVPLIQAVLKASNADDVGTRFKRGQLAEVVDNYVGSFFSSLNAADHPLADELAQQLLLSNTMSNGGPPRPIIDFLQDMTERAERERLGPVGEMEQLKQHLKLKDGISSATIHQYSVTLTVIGPSGDFIVGVGGFIGTLDVKEVVPNSNPEQIVRFIGSFTLIMGQVSGGLGGGVSLGFKTTGTARSPYVWAAFNFPGMFMMADVGGGVSIPVPVVDATGGSIASAMFLHGNGEFPELVADLSGFSTSFGVAASFGISQATGYIFSDPDAQDRAVPGSHRADHDYTASNQAQAEVHFEFGSAVLTPAGREILRIMCANELVALSSSGSSLVISSQADRVDTDQRNLDLSTMRAQNTLQAIKDILGSSLGIPDSRVTLRGLGEQGAKEAGDADHTKNPARRKSDVVLNSRLVATLFGKQ